MAYDNTILALADPTRRTVFERLRAGPQTVGVLAADLPVSRPAISQHLKVLKEAGLVSSLADGARRRYRIDPRGLEALKVWLETLWQETQIQHAAEVARQLEERRYG